MLIKIEDIPTVLVSSEEDIPTVLVSSEALNSGTPNKHRDISWLCIDAVVYSWAMMSVDDVTDELRENVDHLIHELKPVAEDLETGRPVELDYDEVCLLEIHDPVQITVLFNTRAYICNDKGDTIEKIVPKHIMKASRIARRVRDRLADLEVPEGGVVVKPKKLKTNWKTELADNNEPPCLKCAKKGTRLVKDGVFIGTHCEDCGEQHFEYYDAPRMPKVKLPESFPPDKKLGQP